MCILLGGGVLKNKLVRLICIAARQSKNTEIPSVRCFTGYKNIDFLYSGNESFNKMI